MVHTFFSVALFVLWHKNWDLYPATKPGENNSINYAVKLKTKHWRLNYTFEWRYTQVNIGLMRVKLLRTEKDMHGFNPLRTNQYVGGWGLQACLLCWQVNNMDCWRWEACLVCHQVKKHNKTQKQQKNILLRLFFLWIFGGGKTDTLLILSRPWSIEPPGDKSDMLINPNSQRLNRQRLTEPLQGLSVLRL